MDSSAVIVTVLLALVALRLLLIGLGAALILRPVFECPACFGPSFALHRRWLRRIAPWMEWRWCPRCGWNGPARRVPEEMRRVYDLPARPEPHPFDGSGTGWS